MPIDDDEKKFEPLGDWVIRVRRISHMLPVLEGVLTGFGKLDSDAPSPLLKPATVYAFKKSGVERDSLIKPCCHQLLVVICHSGPKCLKYLRRRSTRCGIANLSETKSDLVEVVHTLRQMVCVKG